MRLLIPLLFIFFFSCADEEIQQIGNEDTTTAPSFTEKIEVKHARGFRVVYEGEDIIVEVRHPSDTNRIFATYRLSSEENDEELSLQQIRVPLNSIASVSTTHLPFFKRLGVLEKVKGFVAKKYIVDPEIKSSSSFQAMEEIGKGEEVDIEKLLACGAEALMVYPVESGSYGKAPDAGIPLLFNAEYLETSPLGKAEWIKFVALFFGKEKEANQWFSELEKEYNSIKREPGKESPTVFSGKAFQGKWHVPSSGSFAAQFIRDAGATYAFEDLPGTNVTEVDLEQVIEKCVDAEWWIVITSCEDNYSLNDLLEEDSRYGELNAVKKNQVLFCNVNRVDFFGEGVAQPQVLLKDLIFHFYPGSGNHTPVYFQLLK